MRAIAGSSFTAAISADAGAGLRGLGAIGRHTEERPGSVRQYARPRVLPPCGVAAAAVREHDIPAAHEDPAAPQLLAIAQTAAAGVAGASAKCGAPLAANSEQRR